MGERKKNGSTNHRLANCSAQRLNDWKNVVIYLFITSTPALRAAQCTSVEMSLKGPSPEISLQQTQSCTQARRRRRRRPPERLRASVSKGTAATLPLVVFNSSRAQMGSCGGGLSNCDGQGSVPAAGAGPSWFVPL